jgi:hypothetical protein
MEMTKLIVAFHNFVNAPENLVVLIILVYTDARRKVREEWSRLLHDVILPRENVNGLQY